MSPRWRLRPSLELFPASTGDLYLLRPGGEDLVVPDAEPVDRRILERLAAHPSSIGALARAVGGDVDDVAARVASLRDADAVVEAPDGGVTLSPADAERFGRQLPHFAELGDPLAAQRRLRDARVVVLGCGGLGTWALAALASAGVGAFTLVDHDTVELSNLNRQVLYGADDLGRPKAELAAAWVGRFDPSVAVDVAGRRVEGEADVRAVLDGADALVQAADWPPYELARWVDAACLDAGVPWIAAGQVPPLLKVGPTYVPGRTACHACQETRIRAAFGLYDELTAHRARDDTPATTLGPASGVVGTLLAMEVMHLLAGDELPATAGRALLLDMRTLETRFEAVERDPACPSCG